MEAMTGPAIIILGQSALPTAVRIKQALPGAEIHGRRGRVENADHYFDNVSEYLQELFNNNIAIIGLCAAAILIRSLAVGLRDKQTEPPVLAVSEDGSSIVPLLGGHHGGNRLAHDLASALGGHAAITTASDTRFSLSFDDPPEGYVLANPQHAKTFIATLLQENAVQIKGQADWLSESRLPIAPNANLTIEITVQAKAGREDRLIYHPKTLILGVGCERGCAPGELIELAGRTLSQAGLSVDSIAAIASIDLKSDEPAVHELAAHFKVPARFFAAQELEQHKDRLKNPSSVVFQETGCHGVAEGAALAGAGGPGGTGGIGELFTQKQKSKRATCAIGRAASLINPEMIGRPRGRLAIIGIGPGQPDWRTPEATKLIADSSDLVGYSLYLDLLASLAQGKTRHDFPLGKEQARCAHALELAGEGRSVALICSGDAGIYAMAALVFELLDPAAGENGASQAARRAEIICAPGISALQAAAARAGAPLGHDFCTISLSDLLTPWHVIEQRLTAAAQGDFVIAFYNPVSNKRRTQLAAAKDILLQHRPANCPVILASNLGRAREQVRIVELQDLQIDDVDMLTVVLVGSSQTKWFTGKTRDYVYTPRGYAVKDQKKAAGQ